MENIFTLLLYLDKLRKTQRLSVDIFIKVITVLCHKHCRENGKIEFKTIFFFHRGNPVRKILYSELPIFLPKYEV